MLSDIRNLYKVNLILFILVCICYVNSLGNNFVWDDEAHILRNGYLKDFKFMPQIFSGSMLCNIGIKSVYYRPLQAVSYMLDYHVWKFNPFGYHLTNLLLHYFNVALIFILLYELSHDRLIPFLTSIIFAIHPLHTSAVSFITARAILLVTLFILSSLIFFKKFCELKKMYLLICSIIFSIFALLSKEEALVLPFLIILLDFFFVKYTKKERYHFLQRFTYYLPFFILLVIYWGIIRSFMADKNILFNNRQQLMLGASYFLGTFSEAIKLLIVPLNLHFERLWSDINKIELSGFLGFVLLAVFSFRWSRLAIFGGIWFLICYIPISNIFINLNVPLRENWLYLSSAGFFVMLAVFAIRIHQTFCNKLMQRFILAGSLFTILICCMLTIRENFSCANDRVLFEKIHL